jgi:membrane protein implicated in regulation of membrane protease activity
MCVLWSEAILVRTVPDDLRTYIVAQLPGWVLAVLVVAALSQWTALPGWMAVLTVIVWIVKDLLLFPTMRRYYRSEPAERRIVGQRGTAVTDIAPTGFVRVRGELWQAASDGNIAAGSEIEVRDVQGLHLKVRQLREGIDVEIPGCQRDADSSRPRDCRRRD